MPGTHQQTKAKIAGARLRQQAVFRDFFSCEVFSMGLRVLHHGKCQLLLKQKSTNRVFSTSQRKSRSTREVTRDSNNLLNCVYFWVQEVHETFNFLTTKKWHLEGIIFSFSPLSLASCFIFSSCNRSDLTVSRREIKTNSDSGLFL